MTGLNPNSDSILSISCYITTSTLEPIDKTGFHAVISTPLTTLNQMSEWCMTTHTATGLFTRCQLPAPQTMSAECAATALLAYIKTYVTSPRTALLAGNSVHVDKLFLMRGPWVVVLEYLHYRILDVSAIKEGVRRWCRVEVLEGVPSKEVRHTSNEDVLESIEEARYYMELLRGCGRPERDV